MSSEREEAKAAATAVRDGVPAQEDEVISLSASRQHKRSSLSQAMTAADRLKSALQEERHAQKMKTKEVGWFGVVFGTESLASIVIAFFVIVLSFVTVCCFEYFGYRSGKQEFWSHESQQAFSIITAALGFIFGRSSRDPQK